MQTLSIRSVSGNILRHSDKELPPELPLVRSRCCCYHLALDSAPFQLQFKIMKIKINQMRILLMFMPLLVLLKFLPLLVLLVSALLSAGATHT
jgi:hypothetical protein